MVYLFNTLESVNWLAVFVGLVCLFVTYCTVRCLPFVMWYREQVAVMAQFPSPDRHWFYGTKYVRRIGRNNCELMMKDLEQVRKYKYYFVKWLGIFPSLIIFHPDMIKPVVKFPDRKGRFYNLMIPWLGEGLLIAAGKKWSRNRRLLTPAFHFDILKPYVAVYNEATDILLGKMKQLSGSREQFDVTANISLLTLDIILRCACSYNTDCQLQGDTHPYVHSVFELSLKVARMAFMHPLQRLFLLPYMKIHQDYSQMCQYVHDVANQVIQKRRETLKEDGELLKGSRHLDFLDILLTAKDEDGNGMTDDEIRAEVDTFLFEGHDTTAAGLTWMMFCMAKYPDHQRKIQLEIDEIVAEKNNSHFEWDDIPKMEYLTLCLKESARLYPPVPSIARTLGNDIHVLGKTIKAETSVTISVWGLHHNPHIWDDPEEFRPERFLPENIDKMDPYSYLPFSAGPRNCIGQHFALNEEKIVMAKILHRFELYLPEGNEPKVLQQVVLRSENNIRLGVKER